MSKENIKYSVVLPVYNEEACLKQVIDRVANVLEKTGDSYEIICIDDCSTDQSWGIINNCAQLNPSVKGLRFLRNFGHQTAVFAGICKSSGKFVAVLDSDGQDPPELLKELFEKLQSGYDVVNAVRKTRKANFFKKICYKLFYRFYKSITPFEVPLDSGDFSVFTRDVADFISSAGEKEPFVRGLRSWYGGNQCTYEYDRDERISGTPKYTFYKLFLLSLNGAFSFSKLPLRFISITGIIISATSFIAGISLIIYKMMSNTVLVGWTSTVLVIIFFGGLNLFVMGVVGEYIGGIFEEVKNRPPYLYKETIGIN